MLRIIDLEHLAKDQEAQTVFTFASGGERHGVAASELFEILRGRLAQGNAAKSGNRKSGAPKKATAADSTDSGEYNSSLGADTGGEASEEITLS